MTGQQKDDVVISWTNQPASIIFKNVENLGVDIFINRGECCQTCMNILIVVKPRYISEM